MVKNKSVNSKIRVCFDCGSTLVLRNEKSIKCRDCGNIRYFSN